MRENSLKIDKKRDHLEFEVKVSVVCAQHDSFWVAYCPSLELSSYSDSKDKLMDSFKETLSIYIEETWRKGILEKDLLRLGWALQKVPAPRYEPPQLDLKKIFHDFRNPTIMEERVSLPVFC